eukprot:Gb_05170 [translate_table: standard]
MEGKRDQPWGSRAQQSVNVIRPAVNSSKVEPNNRNSRDFDQLFEGLQVTREERAAGVGGRPDRKHMNGNAANPFDSPPPTASPSERSKYPPNPENGSSSTRPKTRTLCSSFVEVVLRVMVVVLLLLAFILIASDSKTTKLASTLGEVNLKFTSFDAFKYLLSASMIACGFSVIQLVPELYRMYTGEILIPEEIILYVNFLCDQILAYLLLSSTSAGMTASELVRNGYDVVWLSLCSGTGFWSFCAQAAASVSMAFFAFLIMSSLALLSGYRLAKYLVFA